MEAELNRIPKRLNKEPLIEAIWQVQFDPTPPGRIGDLLPGILFAALRNQGANLQLQRLPSADLPAVVVLSDPNLRHVAKYRLEDKSSPFMYQVGDQIMTLNCRRPYSGWGLFRENVLSLIKIVEDSGLVRAPSRHSLRYIDFLTLEPPPSLSSLQISLKLGAFDVQSLPMQTRIEIPDVNCTHVVQVATPAQVGFPEGATVGAIVDLETLSTGSVITWSAIAGQIDYLHDRSKALFFENILTEQAISRMEPEY